jgi:hypothetical protein
MAAQRRTYRIDEMAKPIAELFLAGGQGIQHEIAAVPAGRVARALQRLRCR